MNETLSDCQPEDLADAPLDLPTDHLMGDGAREPASDWREADENLPRLLGAPEASVDLAGFARALHRQTIRLRVSGCAALAGDPALPGRIRGGLGRVLAESASGAALRGAPCPWSPPCAFDVMFRTQGRVNAHTDLPKPWVIAVDPVGPDLEVALTLFGLASEWMPAVAEALTTVLRKRIPWQKLLGHGETTLLRNVPAGADRFRLRGQRQSVGEIEGRQMQTEQGLDRDVTTAPDVAILLEFLSPATVTGHDLARTPQALFRESGNRLEGLARWHALTLRDHVDWRFLKALDRGLEMIWQDVLPLTWPRFSHRQNQEIRMQGVAGQMLIQPLNPSMNPGMNPGLNPDMSPGLEADLSWDTDPQAPAALMAALWPVLALGEATHLGADAAFGCGRYRLDAL